MEVEKKIIRKPLEASRTKEYFLDHINGGGILGKVLSENIDLQKGSFFALLLESSHLDRMYDFSVGGINPTVSTNEVHYIEGKGEFVPQKCITTFWEVSQFIKQFLEESEDNIAIFEDVIQSREDPPADIANVKLHFYENQVYYSLTSKNSVEEIHQAVRRTDQAWHSLVVLAKGVKLSSGLEMKDVLAVVDRAQYVLTSAHDSENCIFWVRT
jgi:hypothetical protein